MWLPGVLPLFLIQFIVLYHTTIKFSQESVKIQSFHHLTIPKPLNIKSNSRVLHQIGKASSYLKYSLAHNSLQTVQHLRIQFKWKNQQSYRFLVHLSYHKRLSKLWVSKLFSLLMWSRNSNILEVTSIQLRSH